MARDGETVEAEAARPDAGPGPGAAPSAAPDRSAPLAGRVALVTGGGSGVGEAVALELAGRGARVVVTGRRAGPIEAVAARHGRIEARVCDAADPEATRAAVDAVAPDVVVANAGMALSAPIARTAPEDLRAMWEVNVLGVHALFAAALAGMEGRAGRLIAVASTAGLRGYPYVTGYAATKHAVVGLVRSLALEVAARGATRAVTVNAVCPGYTETPMLRRTVDNITARTGRSAAEAEAPLRALNPQGRFVETAEVADAVAWLAGPGAGAINGQAISVSGGEVT